MPIQLSGSLVITGSITTTGGITISGSILSASYSDTASFSNNFRVLGDLTASTAVITGTLTAQTLVVQTVTSSIVYSSGSNIFGSALSNTQTFTGSINITGSTTLNGGLIGTSATFGGLIQSSGIGLNASVRISNTTASTGRDWHLYSLNNGNFGLYNNTDGAYAYQITTSGNLGLGVTPSVWYTGYTALQVGFSGAIFSNRTSADTNTTMISNNAFLNSAASNWIYQNNGFATRYTQVSGGHEFYTAASGSANGNITWGTAKLTILSDGNVGIGTTTVGAKLQVAGTVEANGSLYRAIFGTTVQDADMSGVSGGNGSEVQIQSSSTTRGAYLTIGGGMAFGEAMGGIAFYNSNNVDGKRSRAFIVGGQEGATAGEQGSYLSFGTVANTVSVPSERMRITSGGGVGIGATSVTGTYKCRIINSSAVNGDPLFAVDNNIYNGILVYSAGADGYNALATVMIMGRNTSTNRSINAGGTINASGTDYAEYMTKAIEDNIAKGDIVGIDINGLLTNIFADAKSFVVKSTDPSYVGGDTWGNVDDIGKLPLDATDEQKAEHESKIEAARAIVDRIAFSGQVPCNVTGANVGDYIIPIQLENGKIGGQAVTNPTLEQYQISVGKVWKIMEDGRAWIAVKIG
jgi:hypothetical protein